MSQLTMPLCSLFHRSGAHRVLHSFPTRRSSDLARLLVTLRGEADGAVDAPGQAIQPVLGVVQLAERIGTDLEGGLRGIKVQTGGTRPLAHPFERDVGQPGFRVAAADVAVRAAEPHLLHDLPRLRLVRPARGLEGRAVLVDGERLASLLHGARELDVVEAVLARGEKAKAAQRNAQRTYRIPDANHVDGDAPGAHDRIGAPEVRRAFLVRRAARAIERKR